MPIESSTEDLIELLVTIRKLENGTLDNDWNCNFFIENALLHCLYYLLIDENLFSILPLSYHYI